MSLQEAAGSGLCLVSLGSFFFFFFFNSIINNTCGWIILCVGLSWALWNVEQHPWSPSTQCQEYPQP